MAAITPLAVELVLTWGRDRSTGEAVQGVLLSVWLDEIVGEGDPSTSRTVTIVIPAFNEKDRIVPTIGAIKAHMDASGHRWDLIVSDDGSSDVTVALVEGLAIDNVAVVEAPANAGKGAAVRRGMLAAGGDVVLFCDADFATPITELDRLLEALDAGADVVVGSRSALGSEVANRSLLRRAMTFGLRVLLRVSLDLGVTDTQCGFKLFTRPAASTVFSHQTIDGFSFDLEVLYVAQRAGFKIAEVPVRWFDAPGSKVDAGREVVRFLRDIGRIRLFSLQGRYRGV